MAYEQARAKQSALWSASTVAAEALKLIPGVGTGPMGLTPDSVRSTPEYRAARAAADRAFRELQAYNAWLVKTYAAESRAERRARG
jgi:hypothetical protein